MSQIFADRLFEHAVRRRVGDHQARQIWRVFPLWADRRRSTLPAIVTVDHNDLPAICAVAGLVPCRFRNQADIAVSIATRCVVTLDRHQAGVFALRAGVWLHADGVEAGDGFTSMASSPPLIICR